MTVRFAQIEWRGRPIRIEYEWTGQQVTHLPTLPLLIFLHEGLGSLAMWKDFPKRLCDAAGCRGLVYSRPGYGRSTPRADDETWGVDFMHRQAHEVLPALLAALNVPEKPWLFGHSDGGSIALLYAARFTEKIAGVVALAPHIMVEDISVSSIEKTRIAYLETDLRQRLARHHDEPDSAFWGWNRIWLDPQFLRWSIEREIGSIACPVLAIQGNDDEYGTMEQIRGTARRLPQTRLVELADCGHSPHRDQPAAVIAAVTAFMREPGPA
jgi:pimeloyl-ACP methyl ester carboxylesterase